MPNIGASYFLERVRVDADLRQQWQEILQRIHSVQHQDKKVIQECLNYVNNFLSNHGFDCTAKDVLKTLQDPIYQKYTKERKPNKDSDRFVKDVYTNSSLYAKWMKAIKDAMNNSDALNTFLQANGYNCTASQVNSSFNKLHDHALKYWVGAYSVQKKDDTSQHFIFSVMPDGQIFINDESPDSRLNNIVYKNGVLSWRSDDLNVAYGAKVIFTIPFPKSTDKQTVKITITEAGDNKNGFKKGDVYIGFLSTIEDIEKAYDKLPAQENPTKENAIIKYAGYVVAGIWGLKMLSSLPGISKVRDYIKEKGSAKIKSMFDDTEQDLDTSIKGAEDMESPFADITFNDNDVLEKLKIEEESSFDPETTERAQKEISAEEDAEAEYSDAIDDASSGEGWLDDLGNVVADVV